VLTRLAASKDIRDRVVAFNHAPFAASPPFFQGLAFYAGPLFFADLLL
jgi:hypothetical protein